MFKRIAVMGLGLALMLIGTSDFAMAATGLSTVFVDPVPPNIYLSCDAEATNGITFATTSYADVTLASCAFVPHRNDPTGAALQNPTLNGSSFATLADLVWVEYSVDATKATATTGTCAVFVNGAVWAPSARTTGVGEDVLSWSGLIYNTTVGSQTVKLQCKSGDTNILTENFAHLVVFDVMRGPLQN